MNSLIKLGISSLFFASTTAFSMELSNGLYFGLLGGGSYAPSINFNDKATITTMDDITPDTFSIHYSEKLTYNVLANGGGQIGYRCNNFRFEGQFLYNINTYNKLRLGDITIRDNSSKTGLSLKGNTSMYAGFFNTLYDFYDEENDISLAPYIGVGIGYAGVQNTLKLYDKKTQFFSTSDSANAFVAQGILGLSYYFTEDISLGTDVRYITTNKIGRFNDRFSVVTWDLVFNIALDGFYV